MKTLPQLSFSNLLLSLFLIAFGSISCSSDSEPESVPDTEAIIPELIIDMVNPSGTQSTAVITVESSGTAQSASIDIFLDTNSTFESPLIRSVELESNTLVSGQVIRKRIKDLDPEQSYFVRTGIETNNGIEYSNTTEIQTTQINTFNTFEPNDSTKETIRLHPRLGFSFENKGYVFRWDRSDSEVYLDYYNPDEDTWVNQVVRNSGFVETYFSRSDVISFTGANRIFFGFGFSGNEMSRKIYEYLPEINAIVNRSDYPGTSARAHRTITFNDRIFVLSLTNTSASMDSIKVVEYDFANDAWINKASIPSDQRSIYLPSIVGSKIYIVADQFGSDFLRSPSLFEYDVDSNVLTQITSSLTFPSNEASITNSFNINGSTIYLSKEYQSNNVVRSQSVSVFEPSTQNINQLGTLINLDSGYSKQIDASFILGNTIYMETGSGEFYMFELL